MLCTPLRIPFYWIYYFRWTLYSRNIAPDIYYYASKLNVLLLVSFNWINNVIIYRTYHRCAFFSRNQKISCFTLDRFLLGAFHFSSLPPSLSTSLNIFYSRSDFSHCIFFLEYTFPKIKRRLLKASFIFSCTFL